MEFGGQSFHIESPKPSDQSRPESQISVSTQSPAIPDQAIPAIRMPVNGINQPFSNVTSFDTFADWEWASSLGFHNDMNISLPTIAVPQV